MGGACLLLSSRADCLLREADPRCRARHQVEELLRKLILTSFVLFFSAGSPLQSK